LVYGFIPFYIVVNILDIQENLPISVSSNDGNLSCPYELPHAPVGTPQVLSGFLESIEALAQGIGYPLLVSKWLIILLFSYRVTVM
jgi:hypothetical protein